MKKSLMLITFIFSVNLGFSQIKAIYNTINYDSVELFKDLGKLVSKKQNFIVIGQTQILNSKYNYYRIFSLKNSKLKKIYEYKKNYENININKVLKDSIVTELSLSRKSKLSITKLIAKINWNFIDSANLYNCKNKNSSNLDFLNKLAKSGYISADGSGVYIFLHFKNNTKYNYYYEWNAYCTVCNDEQPQYILKFLNLLKKIP